MTSRSWGPALLGAVAAMAWLAGPLPPERHARAAPDAEPAATRARAPKPRLRAPRVAVLDTVAG
jgi:hypothetical protein